MLNYILMVLVTLGGYLLIDFVKKQNLIITWWQWLLAALGAIFTLFSVFAVADLIGEGAMASAMISTLGLGLIAVIWAFLMARFVFVKRKR